MNENDKQVSGMEATANPVPSTGRRRLVKGAMLATPAVMTLMSGRLAAATSITCREKVNYGEPTENWTDGVYNLYLNEDGELGYDDGGNPPTFVILSSDEKYRFYPTSSCLNSLTP